ncbi:MAG: HD domain-containing protein [Anaerolineales bacterium]|mgnify:CR=1 FL=1|nr:HD domain-containing protein [Anaerolineales bacterium]
MTAATSSYSVPAMAHRAPAAARHGLPFSVPARHNPRLQALVERIDSDEELRQLWRSANVNAADRSGLGDHGETHVRIVANAGLRLLRLLLDAGHRSGAVADHGLARADAEVLVVLAAALHDLGLSVHVADHASLGLMLAHSKAAQLLDGLYPVRERTVLVTEALHAVSAHHHERPALTLEAAVLEIADVLDLSEGRLGGPEIDGGGVEAVHIGRGTERPVRVEIRAGRVERLPIVIERLRARLAQAPLATALEFIATVPGAEPHLFQIS